MPPINEEIRRPRACLLCVVTTQDKAELSHHTDFRILEVESSATNKKS